jgi:hypothetical protein
MLANLRLQELYLGHGEGEIVDVRGDDGESARLVTNEDAGVGDKSAEADVEEDGPKFFIPKVRRLLQSIKCLPQYPYLLFLSSCDVPERLLGVDLLTNGDLAV